MANEAELGTRLDKAMLYLEMDEVRSSKKAQVIILELADDENYAPAQKILGDLYEKVSYLKKMKTRPSTGMTGQIDKWRLHRKTNIQSAKFTKTLIKANLNHRKKERFIRKQILIYQGLTTSMNTKAFM